MSWLLTLAQTPTSPEQFDQWLNRGTTGAMMCLLVWVMTKGVPNIISSFKEESKEERASHERVVQAISTEHVKAVEAVTKELASQRDQFRVDLGRIVDKFDAMNLKALTERIKPGQ